MDSADPGGLGSANPGGLGSADRTDEEAVV